MTAVRHVALLLTLAATISARADDPPKTGPAQYQPAGQIAGKLASVAPDKTGGTITLKLPELSMKSRSSRSRVRQATVVQKDHDYDLSADVKVRFHDLPKGPDGKAKHYTN